MESRFDVDKAVDAYKEWCVKSKKKVTEPDLSKTELGKYKGKEVLILRTDKGAKIVMLQFNDQVYSVLWFNGFLEPFSKSLRTK